MNILASIIFATIYQWTIELPSSLSINFYDENRLEIDELQQPGILQFDDTAQTFDTTLHYETLQLVYHTDNFVPGPTEPERFDPATGELRVFDPGNPYYVEYNDGTIWNVIGSPFPAFHIFLQSAGDLFLNGYFRDGNTEGIMSGQVTYNGIVSSDNVPEPASLLLAALGLPFLRKRTSRP